MMNIDDIARALVSTHTIIHGPREMWTECWAPSRACMRVFVRVFVRVYMRVFVCVYKHINHKKSYRYLHSHILSAVYWPVNARCNILNVINASKTWDPGERECEWFTVSKARQVESRAPVSPEIYFP